MTPAVRVRPPMPPAIRAYVILVVLGIITRASLPPPEVNGTIGLGCHVLIVVGLVNRSDVARIAALLVGMLAVLQFLPSLLVIPLLLASTDVNDTAVPTLIDAAINVALGFFVLLSFNRPEARLWTASAPPDPDGSPGTPGPKQKPPGR